VTTQRDLPILTFRSRDEWDKWLGEHHETAAGARLKFAKKDSGIESITHAEALEIALCYGWIDGQAAKVDQDFWMCRFTPRRPRSRWSMINRKKAEELIARGAMKPAGLREVERAKADGRWDAAYLGQRSATVPDDLRRALEANDRALEVFETLNRSNRYAILHRIEEAKRAETRARRIEKYVAMLAEGKKLY
jgi:uncharacterized protein YdeI (YjbR/CyaY-like superfamily)